MSSERRVAVVTGGGQGIGRADALALADEGISVAIIDINGDNAEKVSHEAASRGVKSIAVQADAADPRQVDKAVASIIGSLGTIDILVNNAAIVQTAGLLKDFKQNMWQRDLDVNLTGAFNCTRAVFPGMVEKKWGRIINISSVIGTMGGFGQVSYSSTKAGIIGMTKSVALEAGRHGITVNCIVAGIIASETFLEIPEAMRKRMENRTALKRAGSPEDVASAVVFLASDKAGYITGSELSVAGGIDLLVY
jgi:3-oxoacyl-[acyl-carrier protein] reductase